MRTNTLKQKIRANYQYIASVEYDIKRQKREKEKAALRTAFLAERARREQ